MRMQTSIIGLLLCLVLLPYAVKGQQDDWVKVSPLDQSFQVLMPGQPHAVRVESGISGKGYESSVKDATYSLLVLFVNTQDPSVTVEQYLDAGAEIIWERLLKPVRDVLPEKMREKARMTIALDPKGKSLPGRQYSLSLIDQAGTVQFFLAKQKLFVLLEIHTVGGAWEEEKFFDSFTVQADPLTNVPQPAPPPKTAAPASSDSIFTGRQVAQKARVLGKPEPTYTESARKFGVQGTVILRCVFSAEGKVTNLHVVSGLPHGLTQRAISAARAISFEPAQIDGRPVSMWMQLEYNFNLY